MRVSMAALLYASACVSDQRLYQPPEVYVPRHWDDPTKASTVGTCFAISYPDNFNGNGRMLVVRTPVETTVTVTQWAMPGGWALDQAQDFTVPAGTWTGRLEGKSWEDVDAEEGVSAASSAPPGPGAAILVESDDPIEVLAVSDPTPHPWSEMGMGDDFAMARVLPFEELGTRYRVVVYGPTSRPEDDGYYVVVAVDDDTQVVTGPGTEPVHLDRGEVARVALNAEEISADQAWLVTANRPVAVFSGGGPKCSGGYATGPSFTWEQMLPTSRWGTDYVALPIQGVETTDLVIVTDTETFVQLDCGPPIWLAPGSIFRQPLTAPVRVTGPEPFQVLVESRRANCDVWGGGSGVAVVTPTALYRTAAIEEPLDLDLNPFLFDDLGANVTDVVGFVAEPSLPTITPPAEASTLVGLTPATTGYVPFPEPTLFTADRLRGIRYTVAPYLDRDSPDAPIAYIHADWQDVLYVTHLGYDCTECVPALTEPAVCP